MRFHDLRHSCASILYDKGGKLKDIQTCLGHADIETTADVYTHISNTKYGQRHSTYIFFIKLFLSPNGRKMVENFQN